MMHLTTKTMNQNGLLLDIEKMKKSFDINYVDYKTDKEVSLTEVADINLRGASTSVEIFAKVVHKKYVQIVRYKMFNIKGSIGERRMKVIEDHLENLFLKKEYLMDTYEVESGYLYGKHYFVDYESNEIEDSVFLGKVLLSDMELLLEELDYSSLLTEESVKRRVYYLNGCLYENTKRPYETSLEIKFQNSVESALKSLCFENAAVDEEGNFYRVYPVEDKAEIRLLSLKDNKGIIPEVTAQEILNQDNTHYKRGFTLNELIAKKQVKSLSVPLGWTYQKLPMKVDDLIIHSEKVIGGQVIELKEDDWIQKVAKENFYDEEVGKYGRVIYQQGMELTVQWEDKYVNQKSKVDVQYVRKVKKPFKELKEPQFVTFTKNLNYKHSLRGYGRIVEKTENVAKVQLLENEEETIKYSLNLGEHYRNHSYEEFKSSFKEETNGKSKMNFVLINTSEIDKELLPNGLEHFLEKKVKEGNYFYNAFQSMLELSKAEPQNINYFATLMCFLEDQSCSFVTLVEKFNKKVSGKDTHSTYSGKNGFKDEQIKEWIMSEMKKVCTF